MESWKRRLRMGMVGGGQGAFIGWVHRMAAALDQQVDRKGDEDLASGAGHEGEKIV